MTTATTDGLAGLSPFELCADALARDATAVRALRGTEALSRGYRFDVEFYALGEPQELRAAVLGRRVALVMRLPEHTPRVVVGVAASLRALGPALWARPGQVYSVRVVPALWLLRRRHNSRIFQDKTLAEIVSTVLDEARIPHRWTLHHRYPVRPYSVQHQESDYAFVTRLLAESGVYFFVEPPARLREHVAAGGDARDVFADDPHLAETVVFADAAQGYVPLDGDGDAPRAALGSSPVLLYRPAGGMQPLSPEHVSALMLEHRVRPQAATVRDYDFRHPLLNPTATALPSPARGAGHRTSLRPGGAGVALPAGAQLEDGTTVPLEAGRLEVYRHHGEYDEPEAHQQSARVLLEQLRAGVLRATGTSPCWRLAPGRRFTLDEHPLDELNREYVVTAVEHEARVPGLFARPEASASSASATAAAERPAAETRFTCVPSGVIARPKAPPRRLQQVAEVALVVGPASEEIYVDEHGRIRVQFPWDREGQNNEFSSCWLRVSQAWAGATWGAQFVPRIGMEVLVTFLGGDVDRPVVTGCLYNALNPTAFTLPGTKTRAGWRTNSSPGGVGFNELSFEDAAGSEQVYLRAQRDLDEVVGRNHTTSVRHDARLEVDHDLVQTVGRNRTDTVQGNHAATVVGDHAVRVDGSQTTAVRGGRDVRVTQDLATRVEGRERREVAGPVELVYAQDHTTEVRGDALVRVGRHDAKRAHTLFVEGVADVVGTVRTEISSDKEVLLRCGQSTLRLTPDKIEIVSPAVVLRAAGASADFGDDTLKLRSKDSAGVFAEKVLLAASGATVKLDSDAKVLGSKVHLGAPDNATDTVDEAATKVTQIELVDQEGAPLAYQRYAIVFGDGSSEGGVLNKAGKAEVVLERDGKIVFPDLSEARKT